MNAPDESYRFVVVTDSETAPAFLLSGAEVCEVSEATCSLRLEGLLADRDVGLVGLNDRFLPGLPKDLRRRVEEAAFPVVVPFPDPGDARQGRGDQYLAALIRRAVGYGIRLRG